MGCIIYNAAIQVHTRLFQMINSSEKLTKNNDRKLLPFRSLFPLHLHLHKGMLFIFPVPTEERCPAQSPTVLRRCGKKFFSGAILLSSLQILPVSLFGVFQSGRRAVSLPQCPPSAADECSHVPFAPHRIIFAKQDRRQMYRLTGSSGIQQRHVQHHNIRLFFFRDDSPLFQNLLIVAPQTINGFHDKDVSGS